MPLHPEHSDGTGCLRRGRTALPATWVRRTGLLLGLASGSKVDLYFCPDLA